MGGACSTDGEEETYMQVFVGETCKEDQDLGVDDR
jgi:hypothetical protein